MSSHLEAELAATCSTLGHLHKGEYFIEPDCFESVKDLIRFLKKDNESHTIRRYLGKSKVLQNDLVHIVKSCSSESSELFDITVRLLINLTTPTMLIYGEEIPKDLIKRNVYLSLISYEQEYKNAFCDVEFWNHICGKLTALFEIDWAERSVDEGIQIERILMLLRNVLQVPADFEKENRPENDITIHDKVLWALRQTQILELLLFVSTDQNEEQYFLNLLEIFSLILREQNPRFLITEEYPTSKERNKETENLIRTREMERLNQNKYINLRNFNTTFVMKGIKTLSSNDIVCHKPLNKVYNMDISNLNKKQTKIRKSRVPVENDKLERRPAFSIRLFLKEFCTEFLNCSFNHLMNLVKNRLDSGKSLVNDQSYYFWALNFFLEYATATNADINLVRDCISPSIFHYVQTSMDNAFEHLQAEKKKTIEWVKRIHIILKAYRSLLESLWWMDSSKNPLVRSISREIKSEIFYVVEYREMALNILLKYDSTTFPLSYLKDLIETTHLFIKLLEEFSKQAKLIVQKKMRKKPSKNKKKKREKAEMETKEEKWEKIKDDAYDILSSETCFPEISPFDAASEVPIDDQKGRAMKKIQKLLCQGKIREGIGLLRSARQVWPENDYFGREDMSIEDETMALQEICLADLKKVEGSDSESEPTEKKVEECEEDEVETEDGPLVVEHDFDIIDYKKRLVNKKVVEGCGILLKNYQKNSDHTNHCTIKLLHRIGWECCVPAMLYQASLFCTLLKIMKDKTKRYEEINTFTTNLMRKFRKDASKSPMVFIELLFWKEHNIAMEIQHGYEPYEEKRKLKRSKKKKQKNIKGHWIGNETSDEEELRFEETKIIENLEQKNIVEFVEQTTKEKKSKDKKKFSKTKIRRNKRLISFTQTDCQLPENKPEEIISKNDVESSSENEFDVKAENFREKSNLSSRDEESKNKKEKIFLIEFSEDEAVRENASEKIKVSDYSGAESESVKSSRTSRCWSTSKKRGRNEDEVQDSNRTSFSKAKRPRCIGSDSESDEGEELGHSSLAKKSKRRYAVIDSDSEAEQSAGRLPDDSSRD